MDLAVCPYCEMPGLVTTVTAHDGGMEIRGKCATCGYTVDSGYSSLESADDLPGEFSHCLELTAAD